MSPHFRLSFLLQSSYSIPVITVPQHCIFPVCKLLCKSDEDSKLFISYTNRDHPSHVTVASVVLIVTNIHLSHTVHRFVSQTIYFFLWYVLSKTTLFLTELDPAKHSAGCYIKNMYHWHHHHHHRRRRRRCCFDQQMSPFVCISNHLFVSINL
jgi:hypothetical protein